LERSGINEERRRLLVLRGVRRMSGEECCKKSVERRERVRMRRMK
jgi:hypothetical protein